MERRGRVSSTAVPCVDPAETTAPIQQRILTSAALSDDVLRAVAQVLVRIGNRPSSLAQIAHLASELGISGNDSVDFLPFGLLKRLNRYFQETRSMRREAFLKRVVVNGSENYYYLNSSSLQFVSWVHPPVPAKPRRAGSTDFASAVTKTPNSETNIPSLINMSKSEKKRLLFGEHDSDSKSPVASKLKRPKTLHKKASGMAGDGTDTEDDSVSHSTASKDDRERKKWKGLGSDKKECKFMPPFTDLLATDEFPFVPHPENNQVNSLLLPPKSFYHIQDDRCVNRDRYADFQKCRSCIWKHRDRLPDCFYVGFRAFLVRIPDAPNGKVSEKVCASLTNSIIDVEVAVSAITTTLAPIVNYEANLSSASEVALCNQETAETLVSCPFEVDELDPFWVKSNLQAENLIDGPFFIPGGKQLPTMASSKPFAPSSNRTFPSDPAKKRARLNDSIIRRGEDWHKTKTSKTSHNRRPKSLSATLGSDEDDEFVPDFLVSKSGRRAAANPARELVMKDRMELPSLSSHSRTEDSCSDFPDIVCTDEIPFVPHPLDASINKLLVPAKTYFHIQDDKCHNKKKYSEYSKCRACRWRHRDRLPHCLFVGFRAFLLKNSGPQTTISTDPKSFMSGTSVFVNDVDAVKQVDDEGANDQSVTSVAGGLVADNSAFALINRVDPLQTLPTTQDARYEASFRYMGDVTEDDLLYGPFFIPGGVEVNGHVLATVGPKHIMPPLRKKKGSKPSSGRSHTRMASTAVTAVAVDSVKGLKEADDGMENFVDIEMLDGGKIATQDDSDIGEAEIGPDVRIDSVVKASDPSGGSGLVKTPESLPGVYIDILDRAPACIAETETALGFGMTTASVELLPLDAAMTDDGDNRGGAYGDIVLQVGGMSGACSNATGVAEGMATGCNIGKLLTTSLADRRRQFISTDSGSGTCNFTTEEKAPICVASNSEQKLITNWSHPTSGTVLNRSLYYGEGANPNQRLLLLTSRTDPFDGTCHKTSVTETLDAQLPSSCALSGLAEIALTWDFRVSPVSALLLRKENGSPTKDSGSLLTSSSSKHITLSSSGALVGNLLGSIEDKSKEDLAAKISSVLLPQESLDAVKMLSPVKHGQQMPKTLEI
ncbi:hypothetical protein BC830DRAFT_1127444 [Chytriomyces sp. MP71]|nr:hypothetical protein BC830DRAFT_1127444 [Chytriomyces sp. MP71]